MDAEKCNSLSGSKDMNDIMKQHPTESPSHSVQKEKANGIFMSLYDDDFDVKFNSPQPSSILSNASNHSDGKKDNSKKCDEMKNRESRTPPLTKSENNGKSHRQRNGEIDTKSMRNGVDSKKERRRSSEKCRFSSRDSRSPRKSNHRNADTASERNKRRDKR